MNDTGRRILLNCDMGESFGAWRMGDDVHSMPLVDQANLACGFHAGDPLTMRRAVELAVRHGVSIGAHPAYPDLSGFGRRSLACSAEEVHAMVLYQIGALDAFCRSLGTQVAYVKPHGALYNTIAHDRRQAGDVIAAIRAIDPTLVLVALAGAPLVDWAREAGLTVVAEAFADRAYTPEGTLVSRREKGAVLHDPDAVAARMLRLAQEGVVQAIDGSTVRVQADSICVHGDSPGAVAMARQVRQVLEQAGVAVQAFAA